jgi:hypothetical protein
VNAVDAGWPIRGELNVLLEQEDPQLHGPVGFWQASDAGILVMHAASRTTGADALDCCSLPRSICSRFCILALGMKRQQ